MIDLSILFRQCNKSLERLGDLLVDLYKTSLSCSSQLNCFLAFSLLNSCNSRIESNNINSVVAFDIAISPRAFSYSVFGCFRWLDDIIMNLKQVNGSW